MEDCQIINRFFSRTEEVIRQIHEKYGHFCYKIPWNILENREKLAPLIFCRSLQQGALQVRIVGGAGGLGVNAADGDLFVVDEAEFADVVGFYMAQIHRIARMTPAQGFRVRLRKNFADLLPGADGVPGEKMEVGAMVIPFQIEDGGE